MNLNLVTVQNISDRKEFKSERFCWVQSIHVDTTSN